MIIYLELNSQSLRFVDDLVDGGLRRIPVDEVVLFGLTRYGPVLVSFLLASHLLSTLAIEIERNPANVGNVSETVL